MAAPGHSVPGVSRPPTSFFTARPKQDVGARHNRAFTPVFAGLRPGMTTERNSSRPHTTTEKENPAALARQPGHSLGAFPAPV
jgi:hypothetical protein